MTAAGGSPLPPTADTIPPMSHPPTFDRRGFGTAAEPNGHAGASDEWWTPPFVFDALDLGFDLDPCAPPSPHAPWLPVAHRISLPRDGLTAAWNGRVWLNPPYGRHTGPWLRRLAVHGNGIALVFHRSSTAWYQEVIRAAHAKLEIAGRLSFVAGPGNIGAAGDRGNSNAGADSILLAFGADCVRALLAAPDRGLPGIPYINPRPRLGGQGSLWEMA